MDKPKWRTGQVAEIKSGWHQAGKRMKVLGPAVFVNQWWVPVLDPDEEDPTFFKHAALIRSKPPRGAGRTMKKLLLLAGLVALGGCASFGPYCFPRWNCKGVIQIVP